MRMTFNVCKTCGAKDGRAGMLINDDCENCYDTRNTKTITVHSRLTRTEEELQKTFSILDNKEKHVISVS